MKRQAESSQSYSPSVEMSSSRDMRHCCGFGHPSDPGATSIPSSSALHTVDVDNCSPQVRSNSSVDVDMANGIDSLELARENAYINVSQDYSTIIEASRIFDRIVANVAMQGLATSSTPIMHSDPEYIECTEKRRHKLDNIHKMISEVENEDGLLHLSQSTPRRRLVSEGSRSETSTPAGTFKQNNCFQRNSSRHPSDRNLSNQSVGTSPIAKTDSKQSFHSIPSYVYGDEDFENYPNTDLSLEDVISRFYTSERGSISLSGSWSTAASVSPRVGTLSPMVSKSNIKVIVRCRPVEERIVCAIHVRDNVVEVHKPGNSSSTLISQRPKVYRYLFDHVFDGQSSQLQIFEASTKPLVPLLFEGINGTAFTYGCTSAGKTYTMLGSENVDGIVQMSIQHLFEMKERHYPDGEIRLSFLEVYNESIYDLLGSGSRALDIQEENNEVNVPFLASIRIEDCEAASKLLKKGIKSRKVAMTEANRQSSRSHAVIQLLVQTGDKQAKLSFVDLAGSERLSRVDRRPETLKESSYINQSLLALANCISSISDDSTGMTRIKYRDSKLTLLLKNSLFSNSAIVMITAVHPGMQFLQESSNTLKYAQRAKDAKITVGTPRNHLSVSDYATALKESYSAISLIGKSLSTSANESVKETLQSSPLCEMMRQQPFANYVSLDTLNSLIIDATIEKCASFANDRILSAIKQRWIQVLSQRMDAINRGTYVTHMDSSTIDFKGIEEKLAIEAQPDVEHTNEANEEDDDEFDDAEVETAQTHPFVNDGVKLEEEERKDDLSDSSHAVASSTEKVTPAQSEEDERDDISLSDVSDLDDREPETRDLVIGMLDKITRPSSKRSSAPMWKVKMKYGVLQVNGMEIPFEKLEGEFEF